MAYIKITVGREEPEPFPEDAQPVEIEETTEEDLRERLRAEVEAEVRTSLEEERAAAEAAAAGASEAEPSTRRSGIRRRLDRIPVGSIVTALGVVGAVYGLARVMVRREEVAQVARIELEPDEPAY